MSANGMHVLRREASPLAKDLGALMLARATCSCGYPATRLVLEAVMDPRSLKRERERRMRAEPVKVESISADCGRWTERCGKSALPDAAAAYAEDEYGGASDD